MPDTNQSKHSIDYLTDLRVKETSAEEKQLYDKCCKLVKDFATNNKIIIITPTTRSGNSSLDKMFDDDNLVSLNITGKREVPNDVVFASVARTEQHLKEHGSGNPPKPTSSVPDDIRLILNKTRLGVSNGI